MELLTEKIILLIFLFLCGFLAGIGPYFLRNRCLHSSGFRDNLITCLNCISAGAFFSTFFMHMLPEAQEIMELVFKKYNWYPFAELAISMGFFFVMVIEQSVMSCYGEQQPMLKSDLEETQITLTSNLRVTGETSSLPLDTNLVQTYSSLPDVEESYNQTTEFDEKMGETASHSIATTSHSMHEIKVIKSEKEFDKFSITSDHRDKKHNHAHVDPNSHSMVRIVILLFALSTHALFEGLTIGFQNSKPALRTIVAAVLLHKTALAFSYGMSLVTNKARWKFVFLSMIIFSVMAPIGIGVGALLNSIKDANLMVEKAAAILQAFAAGTFVYVIFIEIIPSEFLESPSRNRMKKMSSLAIGFSFMATLQALPHEEG